MKVSIIIAVKDDNANLRQCIEKCLSLDYNNFEIIVLPDKPINPQRAQVKVIPTGVRSPSQKRDIATEIAQGDILAYIDDDAYPSEDWLAKAIGNFSSSEIAAVCGPAITPPSDNLLQKAGGLVYSSFLVSGPYAYRYAPMKKMFVDDYPSCNFLIRISVMKDIGGFNTDYWPGEDTFLCLKILKIGQKILYDPDVLVYHHRRPLYKKHLAQTANYGLHRGYFVRKYAGNSLKISYFIPSLFVGGVIFGAILSAFAPVLWRWYFSLVIFYAICVLIGSLSTALRASTSAGTAQYAVPTHRLTGLVFQGIILTHIIYGVNFIKGLLSPKLNEDIHRIPAAKYK